MSDQDAARSAVAERLLPDGRPIGRETETGATSDGFDRLTSPWSNGRPPALVPTNWRADRVLSSRGLWLFLGIGTPLATGLAALGIGPIWRTEWELAATLTVLFAALLSSGLVLLTEPAQTGPGLAMLGAAGLLIVSWSQEWPGPFPYLATVLSDVWLVALGWAMYRYPDRRLSSSDRALWLVALVWFLVLPFAVASLSRPEWHEFPVASWWWTIWADRGAYDVINEITNVGTVVLAGVVVIRWAQRFRRGRPAERRLRAPVAVAASVAVSVGALEPAATALRAPAAVLDALGTAAPLAFIAIPVAFLVAVLRRQLAHTRVSGLLLRLRSDPSSTEVRRALSEALEDPGLAVYYWSATHRAYLDEQSNPYDEVLHGDHLVAEALAANEEPLALVVVDGALHRDPDLVQATVTAFSLTLENARLLEEVRDQYAELQGASGRVVKAADAERRALEQNLHDGVQQHFLAVGLMIAVAEARTRDDSMVETLGEMRQLLHRGLKELHDVSHGLRPTALRLGLADAVRGGARHYPFDLVVALPDVQLTESAELTAYYAISESVTNAAKHARATLVTVNGEIDGGTLIVEIIDNGRGGAHLSDVGRGLSGIRDRVTAQGGHCTVLSPPGDGTRVKVVIPCE